MWCQLAHIDELGDGVKGAAYAPVTAKRGAQTRAGPSPFVYCAHWFEATGPLSGGGAAGSGEGSAMTARGGGRRVDGGGWRRQR